ncbi:MAG: TonB-dependent receptor [Vicinamibacterales bacterium]
MSVSLRSLIVIILSVSTLPLLAQTANLEVVVLGQGSNGAMGSVPVVVTNADTGFRAGATTNDQGKVRFESLSTAGRYVVAVDANSSVHQVRAEDVVLRANATRTVILTTGPKSVTAEVSVTAAESVAELNTVNAEVSSSLRQAEVDTLPAEGRDVTRLLYRLPNVTQATGFFPEAPTVAINGANSLYTLYLIDGLDNTENFLGGQKFNIPVGFTREITVLTNNYSVEFGRSGNGIINVTTKSGGNSLMGEVFYVSRPGPSIDSESPFTQRDLSGNFVDDGFKRNQFGFGLGGPIARDRTFYFLNAEFTRDDKNNLLNVPQLSIVEGVSGSNSFDYFSGKVDHRWSDSFSSTLRGNAQRVGIERQAGGLSGGVTFPSAGNTQERNSELIAFNNVWTTSRFVPETNLLHSRFRWNYARPEGNDPQVVVNGPTGETLAILGHPGYVFDDLEKTWQAQQKVTWAGGRHTLKGGVELISSDFSLAGGGNPNGNYTVMLTPAQLAALRARNLGSDLSITDIPSNVQVLNYNIELQPRTFGATQNVTSFYAEDLFSLSTRLNLTAGLRYDYDTLSKGGARDGDDDNFAPRISFNYQLNNRSSLRGGYGLFYDKIVYAIYSDALQQNSTSPGFRSQIEQLIAKGILPKNTDLDRVFFNGNVSASFSGVPYLNGPRPDASQSNSIVRGEARILNPEGYANPYTQQIALGYQFQVAPNMLFYVDAMHNHAWNLYRLRDLNAPAPYVLNPNNPVVRTAAQANATRPVAVVPGGAQNIVVSENKGQSRYRAATFNFVRDRGSSPYAYRLSYTASKLENNTEDINFKAQDANDFGAEWGPSVNDRAHVINANMTWYPVRELSLSLAGLFQSGQPVNRIPNAALFGGTTDLNGDGRSFGASYVGNSDRQPGESRNSDRLPWSRLVDLGVQYRILSRIELRADVFNLFDTVNLSGYSNNATQSNQIQVGPSGSGIVRKNAGPPRQFQFGVRYLF